MVYINILILRHIKLEIISRVLKILLTILVVISCEKDDICLEESESTNRITIGFIDYNSKNIKNINLTYIKGVISDSILSEEFSGNELKLPLMVNSDSTQFILEQNKIKDTLTIFHENIHQYLNRSCGFKSNFVIKPETEVSKSLAWIREVTIEQDSIFNEEKTNIFIHY